MELDFPINEPIFPIRTAAKLLNISVHTLRMYEKEGLIIPFKKASHQRLYSKSDLERIECIRHAICEDKISIAGIKTIYSLIPCSQILNCGENRETCTAFLEHRKPCWMLKHVGNFCSQRHCRECLVYNSFEDCSSIKEIIQEVTNTNNKANYTL